MKLEEKEILRKKRVLEYAEACGNVLKTCRHFGVSGSNFYIWRAVSKTSSLTDIEALGQEEVRTTVTTPVELLGSSHRPLQMHALRLEADGSATGMAGAGAENAPLAKAAGSIGVAPPKSGRFRRITSCSVSSITLIDRVRA